MLLSPFMPDRYIASAMLLLIYTVYMDFQKIVKKNSLEDSPRLS